MNARQSSLLSHSNTPAAICTFLESYASCDARPSPFLRVKLFNECELLILCQCSYYVDPLGLLPTKPLILLPLDQVQKLVNDINRAFKSNVKVPEDPFTLSFFNNGTPQPKFLGRSHSREEVAAMESCIPQATEDYGEALTGASLDARRSFADFKAMMERALAATKRNKQAIKRKKNEDRLLAQEDWCRQLKRAQRYFGLRPPVNGVPLPESASLWVEQPKPHVKEMKACGLLLDPLDTKEVAPHVFENEVIFISIDIEAYERDHRKITEIGVSTLDTLDLVTRPPGEGGENWISQIRSRHFRILGREHLQNREFCVGYADKFQFGSSEWVGVGEAAEIVDKCFEYPFSVQYKFDGVSAPRAPELGAETFPPNQQGIETPLQKDNDSVGTSDLSPSAGAGRTICPMHEMPTWVDIAPESSLSISPVERPEPKLADATFSVKGVDTHGPTNTAQDCANRVAASRILQANNSAEATSYQDNSSTIPSKSFHTHIVTATALKLNSCEGEASLVQVSPLQRGPQERKIILVGHDIGNDLEYLKQLGSQIFGLGRSTYPRGAMEINVQENGEYALTSNSVNTDSRAKPGKCHILRSILESLDTMVLYRVVVKDTQNQSLGRMMLGLERMAWHLHNAGNDARYTLEAMVAMVIKSRLEEDKEGTTGTEDKVPGKENTQSDWNTEVERRVKEKTTQAEFEVRDECQRWEKATATFATSLPIMEGRGTATQARLEDSEPTFQISAQPEISSPGGYCDTAFSEQPSHE